MSGGHFEYKQHRITDFADELYREIEGNKLVDEYGYCPNYSNDVLNELVKINILLNKAADLAHAVDYLYSGDYGEDCFLSKLKELKKKDYSYKSPNVRDGVVKEKEC